MAEAAVEARGEEGEAEAGEGAEDGAGADGGGGVARVRVDEVGLQALEANDGGGGEEEGADVGEDPVRLVLGRPAVDDEADGQEHGAGHHHGHAVLGPPDAAVVPLESHVDAVLQRRARLRAHEEPKTQRDVVEPADAERLAVSLGLGARPERRERRQHDVDEPVHVEHVDGEGLDDDLRRDHAERSLQRDAQRLGNRAIRVVVRRVQVRVAGLLDEALLLPDQQDGRVRLPQEEQAPGLDDGVGDGRGVERPAPGRVLRDEGAGDGADGRPQERREAVDGQRLASVLGGEKIAENAAADGERRRAA